MTIKQKKTPKEKTEPLQVRFPISVKKALRIDAAMNDKTMSRILVEAYALYRAQDGEK